MALDYRKCAEEIFANLGGRENLVSAAHCATRLRLVLLDEKKCDQKKLEDVEGVKGVFSSNGRPAQPARQEKTDYPRIAGGKRETGRKNSGKRERCR